MLLRVRWRVLLHGAVEPAPGSDQLPYVVEITLVLVVAPARKVPVLGRNEFEVNSLWRETPGAVPACEMERTSNRPLHQDVSGVVLVLPESRHGVVLPPPESNPIVVVDIPQHPDGAPRHHLEGAQLLPEKSVQGFPHVDGKRLRPAIEKLKEKDSLLSRDFVGIVDEKNIVGPRAHDPLHAVASQERAQVVVGDPSVLSAALWEMVQENVEDLVAHVIVRSVEQQIQEPQRTPLSVRREVGLAHEEEIHGPEELAEAHVQQVKLVVHVDGVYDASRRLARRKSLFRGQIGVVHHSGHSAVRTVPARPTNALHKSLATLGLPSSGSGLLH